MRGLRQRYLAVPGIVRTLAVLLAGAGLAPLAAVVLPTSDAMEAAPHMLASAVAFAVAGAVLRWGLRLPRAALHWIAGVVTVAASVLLAIASSSYGATLTALPYVWVTLYVAYYFPPPVVRAHAALVAVGMTAAVTIGGRPHMALAVAMFSGTVAVIGQLVAGPTAKLRAAARTDPLTGALNRRALDRVAERLLSLADRSGRPVCLIAIDLDDLKGTNDHHGHAAGDRRLIELAKRWRGALRTSDVFARWGGDEFVALLPDTTVREARALVGRVERASDGISCAIGIYERRPGESLLDCHRRADREMYAHKGGADREAGARVVSQRRDQIAQVAR